MSVHSSTSEGVNYWGGQCKNQNGPIHFYLYNSFAKRLTPWKFARRKVTSENKVNTKRTAQNLERKTHHRSVAVLVSDAHALQVIGVANVSDTHALPMLYKLSGRPGPPLPPRDRRPCNGQSIYTCYRPYC